MKINTKKFPFPDDARLKKVKYIVFGDSFQFWCETHHFFDMKQDCSGLAFPYAEFSKTKFCWGDAFFYTIDGVLTMFVTACGAYADYFKFDEYVFAMCGMKSGRDNHCDNNNFHHHPAFKNLTKERHINGLKEQIKDLEREIERCNKR